MSMFTVYCNDSGTDQESRGAAVAGYIGDSLNGKPFEGNGARLLESSAESKCTGLN
jgi:hypothetical protein